MNNLNYWTEHTLSMFADASKLERGDTLEGRACLQGDIDRPEKLFNKSK